jgi:hypothetical protein
MLPMAREAAKRVVLTLPRENVRPDVVSAPSFQIFDGSPMGRMDSPSLLSSNRKQLASVSYDNVGNVQVAQGDLAGALQSYNDSLAIADRLAKSDPGNAGWQRDLSVSHAKLTSALGKAGKKLEAHDALNQGRAIMLLLTSKSPDHAIWKRDLDWFDAQIADLSQ